MVPIELTLKNFLSYGDEEVTIDFRAMHVVCLSGDNGHGKSAILDAMTWALWGETRLGRQGHEQLIRIGADEMAVTFTFQSGSHLYRVRRQRSKRTSGHLWEVQQADGAGGWKALTGQSSSDTARILQQILRMSYDTFLNSAYLKQGRADEFVRQTSNRRKEILSEVLELSRYDQLEEKAKQRMRAAQDAVLDAERQANGVAAILEGEPRHQQALESIENELRQLSANRAQLDGQSRTWAELRANLTFQRERKKSIESKIIQIELELNRSRLDCTRIADDIDNQKRLIDSRDNIEVRYHRMRAARQRDSELRDMVAALQKVHHERYRLSSEIANREKQILAELTQVELSVTNLLINKKKSCDIEAKIRSHSRDLEKFDGAYRQREQTSERITGATAEKALLRKEHEDGEKQLDELELRFVRLAEQRENCSVCGSPLPLDRVGELQAETESRKTSVIQNQLERKKHAAQLNRRIQQLTAELKEHDNALLDAQRLRDEITKLDAQLHGLKETLEALPDLEGRRQTLRTLIRENQFCQDERMRLAEVETQYAQLLPADKELAENTRILKLLADADDQFQALGRAEQKRDSDRQLLVQAQRQLQLLEENYTSLELEKLSLQDIEERYRTAESGLRETAAQQNLLSQRVSERERDLGRLQNQLTLCAQAHVDQQRLTAECQRAKENELIYKQLASAFGKRGIQTNIIESALPELQTYANDLLERLTDGDMSVHIETTRQAKSKGAPLVETLDIQISDSLGTRPLEMYSGGEAFRVSFALRIALSKLLAHRAGADLQTLIIDEGFGTQDAKGREKLVDAINTIKGDFVRILVITHIDELRDSFASRIEVHKTTEGSRVTVSEGDSVG